MWLERHMIVDWMCHHGTWSRRTLTRESFIISAPA